MIAIPLLNDIDDEKKNLNSSKRVRIDNNWTQEVKPMHEMNILDECNLPVSATVDVEGCNLFSKSSYHETQSLHCTDQEAIFSSSSSQSSVPRISDKISPLCFLCELPSIPGKFDPQKALALGLKKGPDFGKLSKGEAIMASDGNMVFPHDVISPALPGPMFLLVSCPAMSYLPSLLTQTERLINNEQLKCILHMVPEKVGTSPDYGRFMVRFHDRVQHVIFHRGVCAQNLVFQGAAHHQHILHALDANHFPLFYHSEIINTDHYLGQNKIGIIARHLMQLQLTPNFLVERDCALPAFKPMDTILPEAVKARFPISVASSSLSTHPLLNQVCTSFLGTGACLPSKYRNVSSSLIYHLKGEMVSNLKKNDIANQSDLMVDETSWCFVLDCGEGTLGQFYRLFGDSYFSWLKSTHVLFISHMHADHHLGLLRLLQHRNGLTKEPLLIIGPSFLLDWLVEYDKCVEHLANFIFIDAYDLVSIVAVEGVVIPDTDSLERSYVLEKPHGEKQKEFFYKRRQLAQAFLQEKIYTRFGFKRIATVLVDHCPFAYGLVIEHEEGWKVV